MQLHLDEQRAIMGSYSEGLKVGSAAPSTSAAGSTLMEAESQGEGEGEGEGEVEREASTVGRSG